MHLVHGVAGDVEELQRPLGSSVLVGLFDGEAEGPLAREDAQVDLLAEDDRGMRIELGVFERADLFVHRALVAGEGENLAERRRAIEESFNVGTEPHGALADIGTDQLRFADFLNAREIALPHLRVQPSEAANFFRRDASQFSHLPVSPDHFGAPFRPRCGTLPPLQHRN